MLKTIRSLLTSAVLLAGCATITPTTLAQDTNIPFRSTVPGSCTFSNISSGVLGVSNDGKKLSSEINGSHGAAASFNLSCNQFAVVQVAQVNQIENNSLKDSNITLKINVQGANELQIADTNTSSSSIIIKNSGMNHVTINMDIASNRDTLPIGNNSFTVKLTILPFE